MIGFDKYNGEKFERPNMNNEEKERRNNEMKFDTPEDIKEFLDGIFNKLNELAKEEMKNREIRDNKDAVRLIDFILESFENHKDEEAGDIQTYLERNAVALLEVNKRIRNIGLEETKKSLIKEKSHLEEWLRKYKEE